MALQASYQTPHLRPLPNSSLLARFGVEDQPPTSDLTCNASGSKKRCRNDLDVEFSPQIEAIPDLFPMQQPSRVYRSVCTSTNAMTSVAPAIGVLVAQDLSSQLFQQGIEIDTLVRVQAEQMRSELELLRKRHCSELLSVWEQQVMRTIKDKDVELQREGHRNAELEQKVREITAERQIWFNAAKDNEALVCNLKSTLEKVLQNTAPAAPSAEFGTCAPPLLPADDAESCYYDGAEEAGRDHEEILGRLACRVCGEKEVCVLILPCRHLCLCRDCDPCSAMCPVCHSKKNASVQISWS